jgi:hypothetical protein
MGYAQLFAMPFAASDVIADIGTRRILGACRASPFYTHQPKASLEEERQMSLKSGYLSVLLLGPALSASGENQPLSPQIDAHARDPSGQTIINEINSEHYPKVRIFATVLKDGAPLKGLVASDFRVREEEVDQQPITVEPKLPPLSVVIALDTSGSMAKRMKETQAAAMSFLEDLSGRDNAQVVGFAREVKRLTEVRYRRELDRESAVKICCGVSRADRRPIRAENRFPCPRQRVTTSPSDSHLAGGRYLRFRRWFQMKLGPQTSRPMFLDNQERIA